MKPGRFVKSFATHFVDDNVMDAGAMMAYYAVMALFPMVIFVLSLALLIIPADTVRQGLAMATETVPPSVRDTVADRDAHRRREQRRDRRRSKASRHRRAPACRPRRDGRTRRSAQSERAGAACVRNQRSAHYARFSNCVSHAQCVRDLSWHLNAAAYTAGLEEVAG